jgi:hypothetical protein
MEFVFPNTNLCVPSYSNDKDGGDDEDSFDYIRGKWNAAMNTQP